MKDNAQQSAVLLLNLQLDKYDSNEVLPLTPSEWSRFAQWLHAHDLSPASLVQGNPRSLLSDFQDTTIHADRVVSLLDRGITLGFAIEKWKRAGVWTLTRSDPEYPKRLKKQLQWKAPAFLFGVGNKKLLNAGGIAVVGSRDASRAENEFATRLGMEASSQGFNVVSGGARGIDSSAMTGALENEGTVTGVLANGLLQASTSLIYRNYLSTSNLVLVSHINPEARFSAGNAMARNRYIYCLAETAVVVCCTKNKGGTWQGARDNLRHGWVPLWVKRNEAVESGSSSLVSEGANWLPDKLDDLTDLLPKTVEVDGQSTDSVAPAVANKTEDTEELDTEFVEVKSENQNSNTIPDDQNPQNQSGKKDNSSSEFSDDIALTDLGLYEHFLIKLAYFTSEKRLSSDELQELLGLERSQCQKWLKQAVSDERVQKNPRPATYQFKRQPSVQKRLFDDPPPSK